jgi:hypothetical protein
MLNFFLKACSYKNLDKLTPNLRLDLMDVVLSKTYKSFVGKSQDVIAVINQTSDIYGIKLPIRKNSNFENLQKLVPIYT